jgi:methyl-accepting chemotaxis protein
MLDEANSSLYDGAGEMALIASGGTVTAYTDNQEILGKPVRETLDTALQ